MADLTSGSVVVSRQWSATLSNGTTLFSKACSVTLSTMGSLTNKIPATAFGLSSFERSSPWMKSTNDQVVPAGPSNDRSLLLLRASATEAVADHDGVYTCVVEGY